MSKPALVFLCQRLPYPPITGDRITAFNLIRHLTRDYRVFVGTFSDDAREVADIATLGSMVEGLCVADRRRRWSFVRAIPHWLAGDPISFAVFRSRKLSAWLDEIEALHTPAIVVTHSSNVSGYAVDKFRRVGAPEPIRLLHFADVDSEKFLEYADRAWGVMKWVLMSEARRVRREERRLTEASDLVAFVSDEEADLFRSILDAHRDRVVTLPNGVDIGTFDPSIAFEAPFERRGPAFVFTGAMDYLPNVEAVIWFAREVFPGIRRQLPSAQFLIVGTRPAAKVQQLANDPSVIVTGRVASVAAYLAHSQVAVAPLRIARGIQNKVLEAMSMAMPVVVSPGALTGIAATSGVHLVRADTPAEWIEACVTLVNEPERAHRIGRAGRALVMEAYTWEAQFLRLDHLLGSARETRGETPWTGRRR